MGTTRVGETNTLLSVSGLTKSYGRFVAIREVGFAIRPGEILGLIGPNGAGKTTLIECIAGVQPFNTGTVTLRNSLNSLQSKSEVLFYVPDGIAPWPEQPVRWVIDFTTGFFGGRREQYDDVVRDLKLEPLMETKVGALSKGQRKRVMLAIGLLAPQPLLIIDEPFEGLDLRQSREVEATLRKHVAGRGRTMFISIHQIADSARICDRFVLLSSGNVVAEGTLDELTALATKRAGQASLDFEEIFLALT